MSIGQILDRVYRLVRGYWRLILGTAIVPSVAVMAPIFLVMAWWFIILLPSISSHSGAMPHIPVYFPLFVISLNLIFVPIYAFYAPAGVYVAIQANLGVRVTVRQAYSVAWRQYGRYLWLMVLGFLYILIPLAVVVLLIGGGALLLLHGAQPDSMPAAFFLLIPAGILAYFGVLVYSILILLRFAVAFPAAVAEDLPARAALRRSTGLTCGARGRIFVVLLVVYLCVYFASLAFMIAVGLIVSICALAALAAHVAVGSAAFYTLIVLAGLVYILTMTVYAAAIYAAMATALGVIYHDQRWRKEGVFPSALPV